MSKIYKVPLLTDDGIQEGYVQFTGKSVNFADGKGARSTKKLGEEHEELLEAYEEADSKANKVAIIKQMPMAKLVRKHALNGWKSSIFKFSWKEDSLKTVEEKQSDELSTERAKNTKLEEELAELKARMLADSEKEAAEKEAAEEDPQSEE